MTEKDRLDQVEAAKRLIADADAEVKKADSDSEVRKADKLLSVSMAAKRMNLCEESVRRYIRAGKLHAERPPGGGRLRGL